jgi:hypothetical protein
MRKLLVLLAVLLLPVTVYSQPTVTLPAAKTVTGQAVQAMPTISLDASGAYASSGYTGPVAAQLPASLGSQTGANSLSVTPASNATFTVGLPSGASTSALQTTGNTALTTINTTLGSPFQAGGSITNISGTVSLPTGAATSANQTALSAQIPASLGVKTSAASLSVVPASDAAFTVTPAGYSYAHLSTATTTTIKSGAGVLHTLSVNNLGTVASVTTVYDNTAASGSVIAVINTLAGQESYIYDVAFSTGLTIVTTGTVAPDITISYR